MSILIKGMEMPKSCIWRDGKCPLLGDDDNCKLQDCQEDWTWEDQYKGCPLSEAPEPCEDAVSRTELLHIFEENCYPVHYDHNSIDIGMTLPGIVEVLNIATSVIPKRKMGKWLDNYQYGYKCSECGAYLEIDCGDLEMNFCPNCGAKMNGSE